MQKELSGQERTPVQHTLKGVLSTPFKNDFYLDVAPTQRWEK